MPISSSATRQNLNTKLTAHIVVLSRIDAVAILLILSLAVSTCIFSLVHANDMLVDTTINGASLYITRRGDSDTTRAFFTWCQPGENQSPQTQRS